MASTIFDRESAVLGRYLLVLCLTLLCAGCAGKQVVVEGNFPKPLLDPLPVTLGVIYPSTFAQHEFFDEAKGRYQIRMDDEGDVLSILIKLILVENEVLEFPLSGESDRVAWEVLESSDSIRVWAAAPNAAQLSEALEHLSVTPLVVFAVVPSLKT